MLMKLTPGVNFTNSLHASITHKDQIISKNTIKPSVFFALLGPEHIKASNKMLMNLTPGLVGDMKRAKLQILTKFMTHPFLIPHQLEIDFSNNANTWPN